MRRLALLVAFATLVSLAPAPPAIAAPTCVGAGPALCAEASGLLSLVEVYDGEDICAPEGGSGYVLRILDGEVGYCFIARPGSVPMPVGNVTPPDPDLPPGDPRVQWGCPYSAYGPYGFVFTGAGVRQTVCIKVSVGPDPNLVAMPVLTDCMIDPTIYLLYHRVQVCVYIFETKIDWPEPSPGGAELRPLPPAHVGIYEGCDRAYDPTVSVGDWLFVACFAFSPQFGRVDTADCGGGLGSGIEAQRARVAACAYA